MVNTKLQLFNYLKMNGTCLVAADSPALHYKVFAMNLLQAFTTTASKNAFHCYQVY
jgi:hypothetical protein